MPVAGLAAVLPLMADMAQRPTFPAPELERARRQRVQMLRGVRDDPDALAALAFASGVYGPAHRNAAPLIGSAGSLAAMTVEDVAAFIRPHTDRQQHPARRGCRRRPDGCCRCSRPTSASGSRQQRASRFPAPTPAARRPARQLLLADVPNAPQSRILVGGVSATSSMADYFPIQLLNAILRGRFGSARNPTLRDYTTGVRPGFDRRQSAGPLAVATAVQGHKTAESLAELISELADITKGIAADELARAKGDIALEFSRTFEATGRISSRLQALESLVDLRPAGRLLLHVRAGDSAVGADDVRRVAAQYLDPDHLVIAIAGDRKTIEPRIRALDIGSLTTVSIDELFAPAR